MTPPEREARAIRVRAMLEQPDFQAAWDSVRQDFTDEWARCHDPIERESLWRAVNTLDLVRTRLASFMSGISKIDGAMSAVRRA